MEGGQKSISTLDDDAEDALALFFKGLLKVPVLISLSVLLKLLILYTTILLPKLEYRVELANSLLGLPYSIHLSQADNMADLNLSSTRGSIQAQQWTKAI